MTIKKLNHTLAFIAVASASFSLLADDHALMMVESEGFDIALGLGIVNGHSIYQDVDNQSSVLPIVLIRYDRFFFEDFEFGYNVIAQEDSALFVKIAPDTLDDERSDGPSLKDMGDVDSTWNVKLGGELFTNFGLLSGSLGTDIRNKHDGSELTMAWAIPLELSGIMLMTSLSATWMSEEIVNHYYGVSGAQAKTGRPQYEADDSWRYGLEVFSEYPLNKQWTIIGGVAFEWFDDEVSNSPIVDDDQPVSAFMGASFNF